MFDYDYYYFFYYQQWITQFTRFKIRFSNPRQIQYLFHSKAKKVDRIRVLTQIFWMIHEYIIIISHKKKRKKNLQIYIHAKKRPCYTNRWRNGVLCNDGIYIPGIIRYFFYQIKASCYSEIRVKVVTTEEVSIMKII